MLFFGLPCLMTVATAWLLASRQKPLLKRRLGLIAVLLVVSASFTLVRMDGLSGEQESLVCWRWRPSAEDLFLAERAKAHASASSQASGGGDANANHVDALQVQPGDWPAFRGPAGDGEVRDVEINSDWNSHPPRLVWRQRIGPAWSSMAIIGKRLFTQEQRGEFEAVVCLDTETGRELWAHEDLTRFWEPVSGAGPRATPTFADGRLFTLGGNGLLNCLDAATGRKIWSRSIADDSGAPVPQWAFCSSPLVIGEIVVTFAGGAGSKQLLAYQVAAGEPAWSAPAGQLSYSSPQSVSIDGQPQIVILNDHGVTAVAADTGRPLWEFSAPIPGAPRSVEVNVFGPGKIVVATESGIGMVLLEVRREGEQWSAIPGPASNEFKPAFSDFVVHNGLVFGFDGAIFACVDIETGKRRWKKGRYGHGQVVLLRDQGLLLVLAESGEVILLPAIADRPEELGRYQSIEGKTWNHPAIAHGKLYVRNAEQIACYVLAGK